MKELTQGRSGDWTHSPDRVRQRREEFYDWYYEQYGCAPTTGEGPVPTYEQEER